MPTSTSILLGLVGSIVTIALFLLSITFRMGEHSSDLRELKRWRDSIRIDMHEISDQNQALATKLSEIKIMIEERTDRRRMDRTP